MEVENPENRGWIPNELDHAGRENLDNRHVQHYDQKEDADPDSELKLLKSLGLNRNSTIIDLGAGTGQFAIAASQECSRVIAVDVSPVMLNYLKNRLRELRIDNIETVQAGFLSYQHPGEPVDAVYSRFALHHLPDFWKVMAIRRIRSMLPKNGIFRLWDVVYSFTPGEATERLNAWCNTLETESDTGWTRSDIEEHIRDEHSTYSWLLEPMIQKCGFVIEESEISSDKIFARYVARAI